MANEAQSTEHELLKTGLAVGFRIVGEEVLTALDEAEFGMRLELKFVARTTTTSKMRTTSLRKPPNGDHSRSCLSSEYYHVPMRNRATSRLLTIAKRMISGLQISLQGCGPSTRGGNTRMLP